MCEKVFFTLDTKCSILVLFQGKNSEEFTTYIIRIKLLKFSYKFVIIVSIIGATLTPPYIHKIFITDEDDEI